MQKNNFKYPILVIFLIFLFVFVVFNITKEKQGFNYRYKVGEKEIVVEIASGPEAQARGLSGRESLDEDRGMLFDFDKPDIYYFWMKDMNFPIDIIWFDENRKIIYIEKNATPESYPQSFGSDQNAKYVLEVVSGFTEKYNLKVGDTISVLRTQ